MLRSFRASLPLILVIMTAGSDAQDYWGVNYSPSYVCALKGSTVQISCKVKYHYRNLRRVFWTKYTDKEPPDLCSDPDKTGRVQCVRADRDTSRITLTAVTEADKHIYYCRFTTDAEGEKLMGTSGVQLDVTDLQVETQRIVVVGNSVTLSCKSSCSLPEETTFIWYRNTKRLTGETLNNQLHLQSVSRSDAGEYKCAARGNEHLKSPPVYVRVESVDGWLDWGVNYSPSYVCALKGSTVKISCTSTYSDDYKLTPAFWTKTTKTDGEPPDLCSDPDKAGRVQCVRDKDTSSITLTAVTEADKHIYYCRCTDTLNKRWTVRPGVRLYIADLQVETQQTAEEGDSVTLSCKSSCSLPEETTFIWYRNTERLTGETLNNQLHLQSVRRSDAGEYRCAARGKTGERLNSTYFYLNVHYPPKSVSVSVSGSAVIVSGDSVTLSCSSDLNPPAVNFTWLKEEASVGSGRIFSISNISSDHSGEYKCRARNRHGEKYSDPVTLNVLYPPRNVSAFINGSAVIVSGDSVTLSCSSDSNPPAEISWLKGETSVGSGGIFSISNISSDHSGEYKCRARNEHGEKNSDPVILNVMYPPRNVSVFLNGSAVIVSGDSVTLSCSSDSNPPAEISFYKDETSVGSGEIYRITNIKSEASGNYSCSAKNKHGSQKSAAVTVNVMYPPRNVSVFINGSAVIVSGDSVTLSCSSDSNPPAVKYIWFKETQGSAVGSGQSFSALDSGRYYCEAENKYGSQRSESVSVTEGVQRSALLTLTGVVAGCGGLIIIIIIIIIVKKNRRDGKAEDTRQNQQNLISRSAEMASTNDSPVYSLVSANQSEDLYAKVNFKAKKAKRSSRAEAGDVEDLQYASVHFFKNKDMKTEEHQKMEMQRPSDANRCEDVIYSSVK
ncbi:Fc receptor-like protein 5 isoform X1 [Danio rerio]|uniref:Fc receptor-like protein 5 isoform X1 n=1 Tax=Danio rerio TaxID=7955 RepID=A0AC58FZ40_DANRE